ncbi:MAG: PAS domain S-box protein [Chloroflexota bacterium]|jgi:PAS domain S-box-containing protein
MSQKAFPRRLAAALVLALLVILAGGGWLYRAQEQHLREDAEKDLEAIAELKANQIAAWRAERLADAAVLGHSLFFIEGATHWLADPQAGQAEMILSQFQVLQEHYGYHDVLLVDADGQVRLSLRGQLDPLADDVAQALSVAWRDRQPVLIDLHTDPGFPQPYIEIITPLFLSEEPDAAPVGAVILQSDASQFLYPLFQSWPTPSKSAETLLVRRDGDAVLFLNDLRHQPGAALTLRIPLSQTDVPMVMAVLGREGVVEGKDYRGVEVLSVLHAIPDSPWYMVSKVDKAEVLAVWRTRSILILALIAGLVTSVGTAAGITWQRTQKEHYRTLLQAEKARQKSEAHYHTVLLSIGDGVITTDAEGRVELLNPVAEMLTGWSADEARGKPLEEVFGIISEETRQPVANPVRRVMQEGIVVGLANHTLLIAKDGREIPIADSGAPIYDADGDLTGVVLVFRDQTEERAAQKALRESEAYIRTILDNLPIGVAVNSVDPTVTFSYMNDNFVRCYRTTRESLADPDTFWEAVYENAEFREAIKQRVVEDVASGDPERMHWDDVPITRKGEETTFISARNVPIHGTQLMLSAVWDTTERKRAEEAEYEQRVLAEALRDTAAALIGALDLDAVMNTILENVARVVPNDASNIMLIIDDQAQPVYWHGYGPEKISYIREFRIPVAQTENLQHMVVSGLPFLIPHTEQYPGWVHLPVTEWVKSYVGAPIRSHDNVIGFLNLDSGTPGFFNESHTERLRAFANLVSIAIEQAQLYEQIQRYADELEQRVIERTAELNHAKERTEAILNSSSDVIILCRPDRTISQVNPAFERIFEGDPDEVLNQPFTMLAAPEHVATVEQAFATVTETQQPQRLEVTVHHHTGKAFDADVVLSPMVEREGNLLGIVCSLRDITLRKRMEAQLRQTLEHEIELNELKTHYVSMAAHDLRNPLAIIQSSVSMIRHYYDQLTEEQKQARFDQIQTSIKIMVDMLDDILTMGKVESGAITFNPAPLNPITFCQSISTEISQATGAASRIVFSSQGDCSSALMDAKLLRHILGNLLSNALKYSPGERAVRFSVHCDPNQITFRIEDQGIGIPQEEQKRMFEAFHRASNAKHLPGTGLGLAIVKQSVELHGGTVAFESTEGVGTTFTVVIPQVPS